MKLGTRLLLIVVISFQINLFSQIPNAGFENWTAGTPDGWYTNSLPGFLAPVTQSNSARTGSSAAKLEILNFLNSPYLPQLWSGDLPYEGFPIDQAYGSLTGYYQLSPNGSDGIFVSLWMLKGNEYIGGGAIEIYEAASSYTQFSVAIEYFSTEVPDSAIIWFIVGGDTSGVGGNIGSFALIDDLEWGPVVDVKERGTTLVNQFEIKQNYPNPFNPSTKINFSIPEQSDIKLIVYDVLGNEVKTLISENYHSGDYSVDFEAENLPAGVYIAKLSAGSYSHSIKMILLK